MTPQETASYSGPMGHRRLAKAVRESLMSFPGEDRYREALVRAEGHEGASAMVKVADLRAALEEIDLLRTYLEDAQAKLAIATKALVDIVGARPGDKAT